MVKNQDLNRWKPEPKKVLISAPIGGHKQYSINLWFEWIVNQDYSNIVVCICSNGDNRKDIMNNIDKVKLTHKSGRNISIINLELPRSDDLSIIQKITYSRETIRRFAVKYEYDAIFWLDTDTIPANKNAISRLLSWNVDSVSGLYFYKNSAVPVVIDADTHTNVSMEKLNEFVNIDRIMPVWGTGYGCLLHQGKAMKLRFDYELFGEERTDDFGHCHVLEQNNVLRWLDPFILCKHFADNKDYEKINDFIQIKRK